MIAIQTNIKSMPKCCCDCRYYIGKSKVPGDHWECLALANYDAYRLCTGYPSKERQEWCPLVEVKE